MTTTSTIDPTAKAVHAALGLALVRPAVDKHQLMTEFAATSKALVAAKRKARRAVASIDGSDDDGTMEAMKVAGVAVEAAVAARKARAEARVAYAIGLGVSLADADLDFCEYALREAALVRDHRAALAEAEDDELVTGVQLQAAMA